MSAAGGWAWSFVGGVNLVVIAFVFLLGLPWNQVWPILIIIAGVGMLLDRARGVNGPPSRRA